MKLYGIIGCGGFGREVMPIARDFIKYIYGSHDVEFVFVVENLDKPTIINEHKVISETDFLSYNADEKYFNIAIANYQARERIANKMIKSNVLPFKIQAMNAVIYDNNEIGDGVILCGFTAVTSNAKIGKFFHSNVLRVFTPWDRRKNLVELNRSRRILHRFGNLMVLLTDLSGTMRKFFFEIKK